MTMDKIINKFILIKLFVLYNLLKKGSKFQKIYQIKNVITHLSTREKCNKIRRACLITASGLDHDLHPSWRVKQSRVDKSRHAAIILRIFNLSLVTVHHSRLSLREEQHFDTGPIITCPPIAIHPSRIFIGQALFTTSCIIHRLYNYFLLPAFNV